MSFKRKRRKQVFNPNSQFIADAVEEFLKTGGRITQIEVSKNKIPEVIHDNEHFAYDFLTEGINDIQ